MELPTRYEPARHEGEVYAAWTTSGGFSPREPAPGRGTFTVQTGSLVIQVAAAEAEQDALVAAFELVANAL